MNAMVDATKKEAGPLTWIIVTNCAFQPIRALSIIEPSLAE
jgi:hypothetical protein